ncbi:hypothetical protein ACE38V_18770 [Cytobacillus sp. Hz8]|uniref:hypothetical protein n=1 Tax=Cytobacillus sp. Hz8 TaxID=3347168 RepID=UPI0035D70F14
MEINKLDYARFLTFGIVFGIIGLIILLLNVHIGLSMAKSWLIKRGGADPAIYHIVMKGYINTYLVLGSILLCSGLITVAYTYLKLKRKSN